MQKLRDLKNRLQKNIIGQEEVLEKVSKSILRNRVGIRNASRPLASFVFMGPSGVGKTETVKQLAKLVYEDKDALIKIDMSEFMEKHSVARMIGAPPGYVGYDEGGYLTEAVRRRPYSVILFDEIEKAHGDVFNVLLQILDDGRLTDGKGRTVDFKNSIIIMTSNLGSQLIYESGEIDTESLKPELMQILQNHFRPEFLNRLDDIIIFHRLSKEHIRKIVDIQLSALGTQLEKKNLLLSFTDSLKAHFAQAGFDPQYGARPLKRLIQKELEDFLAKEILAGKLKPNHPYTLDYTDQGTLELATTR